jgi:hypothetical protein
VDISITPARRAAEDLAALGVPVPADLTEALALHDEAANHTGPDPIDVQLEALTVKPGKVGDLIDKATAHEAQRISRELMRLQTVEALTRRALRALNTCAEDITVALEPVFTSAATAFVDAVSALPPGWDDADTLVRAGADAVAALHEAKGAVAVLDTCRAIRNRIPALSTTSTIENGTLYCKVTDNLVCDFVNGVRSSAGPLGYFGNLTQIDGVTELVWWPTQKAHRDYIATIPQKRWVRAAGEWGPSAVEHKEPVVDHKAERRAKAAAS